MSANELPGDPTLPPGMLLSDLEPPRRRREDEEDDAYWLDVWRDAEPDADMGRMEADDRGDN
jgi:hypothetical protein